MDIKLLTIHSTPTTTILEENFTRKKWINSIIKKKTKVESTLVQITVFTFVQIIEIY